MSDGLVSNVGLILGVAGAAVAPDVVRVAGLAGLVAGAISMAAGEYNSMRVQSELLERELAVERRHLAADPEAETLLLTRIYEAWFFTSGMTAIVTSLAVAVAAAVIVGVAVARFAERPAWFAVLRQVLFTLVPALITYAIGSAIGVSV